MNSSNKLALYLFLILFTLSINGCKEPDDNPFNFNNKESSIYYLKGEKLNDSRILNPERIVKKGTFLIISEGNDVPMDKPIIHLLNIETLEYLSAKGKNGIGPNEITDAYLIDSGYSDSTFWVNSVRSKRMVEFSLYDTTLLSINEFRQPENMMTVYQMYKKTDSTFLCLSTLDEGMFNEYNEEGIKIASFGHWPNIPNDKRLNSFSKSDRNFLLSRINGGWFRKDSESSLFALSMAYRDRIEIFNSTSEEWITIEGPRTIIPPYKIGGKGINIDAAYGFEVKYGHRDLAFGKRYLYDLYSGYSEFEYRKSSKLAQTVYILSKYGEVQAKLNLDYSVQSITVDESRKKLYGITTDEEPGIAVFDLPQELFKQLSQQKTLISE